MALHIPGRCHLVWLRNSSSVPSSDSVQASARVESLNSPHLATAGGEPPNPGSQPRVAQCRATAQLDGDYRNLRLDLAHLAVSVASLTQH